VSRPDLTASSHALSTLTETSTNIVARAQGVFLWVKLITTDLIEGLMDGESPTDVKQRLLSLPGNGDLQELYRLIMVRLNPTYMREAYIMLQIAYSTSQVSPLSKFFEAVNYVQEKRGHLEENDMARKLVSRCRGFLEIQPGTWQDERTERHYGSVVQFLHQSVKDYLTTAGSFEIMRNQLGIAPSDHAESGHVYLLHFRTSEHLSKYKYDPTILAELPSFDLRKMEVFHQARMVEKLSPDLATGALDALAEFIDSNKLAGSYLRIDGWDVPSSWKPTFLSLAVQAGLTEYVSRRLQLQARHDKPRGRPLLHYASVPAPPGLCGPEPLPFVIKPAIIKALVMLGENTNEIFEGKTAFIWALEEFVKRGKTSEGQLRMLEALLEAKSDPNFHISAPSTRNRNEIWDEFQPSSTTTALCIAVRKADQPLTNLLLKWNADDSEMTVHDWDNFESSTKPLSLWKTFRSREDLSASQPARLQARELEICQTFYNQAENKQNPEKLSRLFPGQLEVRVRIIPAGPYTSEEKQTEVFVIDHQLILRSEPNARPYLILYGDKDVIQPGLPKALRDCSPRTRSRVLAHWATPRKSVHYF
jgi:hypothetical protein